MGLESSKNHVLAQLQQLVEQHLDVSAADRNALAKAALVGMEGYAGTRFKHGMPYHSGGDTGSSAYVAIDNLLRDNLGELYDGLSHAERQIAEDVAIETLASDPQTPPSVLDGIARKLDTEDMEVLVALARNPNLNKETVTLLSTYPVTDIATALVKNPNISRSDLQLIATQATGDKELSNAIVNMKPGKLKSSVIRDLILKSPYQEVREAAIAQPDTPKDAVIELRRLESLLDKRVAESVEAKTGKHFSELGQGLQDELRTRTLIELASDPDISRDLQTALQMSENPNVRAALAANPSISESTRELLAHDNSPQVLNALIDSSSTSMNIKSQAEKTLEIRGNTNREAAMSRREGESSFYDTQSEEQNVNKKPGMKM